MQLKHFLHPIRIEKGYGEKVIVIYAYMLQRKANRRCEYFQSAHYNLVSRANKYFPYIQNISHNIEIFSILKTVRRDD